MAKHRNREIMKKYKTYIYIVEMHKKCKNEVILLLLTTCFSFSFIYVYAFIDWLVDFDVIFFSFPDTYLLLCTN